MRKNTSSMLLIIVSLMVTSHCFARKEAINNFTENEVSQRQRYIYNIHDFLIGEFLGLTDVSPETEHFVRKIQKKMEMEHITIRLRSMSRKAMRSLSRENAAAVSVPFANTIIISEEWFNSLPEKEKRALIGHELAHIKNKHIYKLMGIGAISSLISILTTLSYFLTQKKIFLLGNGITPLLVAMVQSMYSRMYELEADSVSAEELHNIDGCIDLMKRFKNLRDPHSRFPIKQAIRRTCKFISYPIRKIFASHPKFSKRIKNLEQLAEKE